MQILVLGGTAFLSRAVAARAVARGHEVTCLARGVSGAFPAGVHAVRGDRTDPAVLDAIAGHAWDAVVDVARRPSYVRTAAERLADASYWLYVSTCSVYRNHGPLGADETAPTLDPLPADADETDPDSYGSAKSACEGLVQAFFADRSMACRAGLVVGPGDPSDRFGYWPAALSRGGAVLAPGPADALMQVIDVADLAGWLVDACEQRLVGVYDAVGPAQPMATLLDAMRDAVGSTAELVWADPDWLTAHGVAGWSGPESVPLWIPPDPDWTGFGARSGAKAREAGLRLRPLADTARETLADEQARGLDRDRRAGLTWVRQDELVAAWRAGAIEGVSSAALPEG